MDARRLRERPVPDGHCKKCFHSHARELLTGCCVCSGHIDLTWRGGGLLR